MAFGEWRMAVGVIAGRQLIRLCEEDARRRSNLLLLRLRLGWKFWINQLISPTLKGVN